MLINDPEKLEAIRKREADITKERIQKILDTGANVILTTQGIDDLCLKYFVEAGAMAVRRVTKDDMKRIARATGATMVMTLANMEGDEVFDASNLGYAEVVEQERICDDELIVISKPKAKTSASVILRGANDFMLDEVGWGTGFLGDWESIVFSHKTHLLFALTIHTQMERALHDALCVVKRVLESKALVPGGGAVEAALSIYLENFATSMVRTMTEGFLQDIGRSQLFARPWITEFPGTAGHR